MSGFEEIELSAAVRAIREQLTLAAQEGENSPIRFGVGPIQMEFAVELRREAGAKGGVKAWVVSADAEAKRSQGTTHRVSFTLTPTDAATGRDIEIGDHRPAGVSRLGRSGDGN
jgi:hypothetical protein